MTLSTFLTSAALGVTYIHQPFGDSLGDVLEMHCLPLDQTSDRDHHVALPRQCQKPGRQGQFKRPWHGSVVYIFVLDASLVQSGADAFIEGIDNLGIPACLHDANAARGPVQVVPESDEILGHHEGIDALEAVPRKGVKERDHEESELLFRSVDSEAMCV